MFKSLFSTPPPPPQDYPAYLPAVPAVWKRKWVQITGTSLVAFVVGAGVGGVSTQPSAAPASTGTEVVTPAKPDSKVVAALAEARDETDRLNDLVTATATHERLAIAQVQATGRASQRKAVVAAKARVRASASVRQERAVAAAVKQAKADAASQSAPPPSTSAGTDPRFSYCYEANDAGFGDYVRGQDPEYDWYSDNDDDGIVCET